jgi:hypothetical protein
MAVVGLMQGGNRQLQLIPAITDPAITAIQKSGVLFQVFHSGNVVFQ